MPRLPRISGAELVRVLERHGYTQTRTRGSHVRLYPSDSALAGAKKMTVPLHKELKTGTLAAILKDVGLAVEDIAT